MPCHCTKVDGAVSFATILHNRIHFVTFFKPEILARHAHTHARVTKVSTPHGDFMTPCFMPVGTRAGVNCATVDELNALNAEIILGGNTYHMLIAPKMEVLKTVGGMHPFMGWHKPMLTDSGGFQVFSLSKNSEICTIDEEGAHFQLPGSQEVINMTPEVSLATQKIIGADIIMAFDQCTPSHVDFDEASKIMQRTHRWLAKSRDYQATNPNSYYGNQQALFGIIQGGVYPKLREISAQFVVDLDFDGIAIGGESIGFDMKKTQEIIDWVRPSLPEQKTRYTMGVGLNPQDLLDVIFSGIDIFDCVAPTRNARHGALYSGEFIKKENRYHFESKQKNGCLQIKRQEFATDETPLMKDCACYTCKNYTKASLHYLFKQKTVLFATLASIHNLSVMQQACTLARALIIEETL